AGRYWIVYNGEIYNYLELRQQLSSDYEFRTCTDSEVLLAAYTVWGEACLERLTGMFAFAIWDERERSLFAARDRFGVKPFYYHQQGDGTLLFSSEIKALQAAGVQTGPDLEAWSTYLVYGVYDHSERSFWDRIRSLGPGHMLRWRDGRAVTSRWYDLAERTGSELDARPVEEVREEYLSLLIESVRLRFRSDVPVGINLSGGLDSSILLGLVQAAQGADSDVKAFTFVTGDPRYDELPWVHKMLSHTLHPSEVCLLEPQDVPSLAESVQAHEDEPFGGLPTLAYARLFERAREEGVIVLLDGQGMDEQWAGYDYYVEALNGEKAGVVQGMKERATRPECLAPDFRDVARPPQYPEPFPDRLRNLQYRDIYFTKIPRALRFNDRVSMRSSTELREPFMDHRLFELALRQPAERKVAGGVRKWLPRQIGSELLPGKIVEAPKRPLQTPQREWLRGPLRRWAEECISEAVASGEHWFDGDAVERVWREFLDGASDNSFYIWQWINVALMTRTQMAVAYE
ncbi:MAG TPA: asparagine synthase (glutamine-hydrolyzing), partial [Blastocatellia bacterium]|nr:asparagine synthase (glutamine-hydrolyzing) [Blastocatellia bacterium]